MCSHLSHDRSTRRVWISQPTSAVVTRTVENCQHEGKPARKVIAERAYDTVQDDLWDAITNGSRIPRWFLPVSGDLRLVGRYQLEGNAGGTITECGANDGRLYG